MIPAARRALAAAALSGIAANGCTNPPPKPYNQAADTEKLDYPQPESIEKPSDYDVRIRLVARVSRSTPRRTEVRGDGGALPPASVQQCESRGDYSAQNRHSSASGGWQITDGSWGGYGGYAHAKNAPPEVQDARAAELWAGGRGASHWKACL